MHLSVRHVLRPVTARSALLRAAAGAVERRLLPGADAVIALTPSTARLLRGDGIPAGRVHVIAPGYDPAVFAAASADPFGGLPRPAPIASMEGIPASVARTFAPGPPGAAGAR